MLKESTREQPARNSHPGIVSQEQSGQEQPHRNSQPETISQELSARNGQPRIVRSGAVNQEQSAEGNQTSVFCFYYKPSFTEQKLHNLHRNHRSLCTGTRAGAALAVVPAAC